ncbi:MAG TPA: hypothetical protein VH210_01375 [Gaiellaceae bacterium]|jgi:2-phospho-L-lactate guanylyltransferase (CobY/MobA/RfbA family)|nr:hypothetical protein [Gaiellaceae bacterium]
MATVVVPFRSTDPKRRLSAVVEADRIRLAHAMLEGLTAVIVNLKRRYRAHAGVRITGIE